MTQFPIMLCTRNSCCRTLAILKNHKCWFVNDSKILSENSNFFSSMGIATEITMDNNECNLMSKDTNRYQWMPMDTNGCQWMPMDAIGYQ